MVYSVMVPRLLKVGFHILLPFLLISFHVDHAMSTNDYIGIRCNSDASYDEGSEFEINMKSLFSNLTSKGPPVLFANATAGGGLQRVYGLVQCRGDVDQDTCNACIYDCTMKVVGDDGCPHSKDAIIWYEKCQLRYSNYFFFGYPNVDDSVKSIWTDDIVQDPTGFDQKLGTLLNKLTSQATTEPSNLMFATESIAYNDLQTIYGLVQCTRDISLVDCSQCLNYTISQIPTTCEDHQGCEIVTGSCRVRFDTEMFYNMTSTSSPSPVASPSKSSPSLSPRPSSLPNLAAPSDSTPPPSGGASDTTSEKMNHSSAISVTLVTVITFSLTYTWPLVLLSWL